MHLAFLSRDIDLAYPKVAPKSFLMPLTFSMMSQSTVSLQIASSLSKRLAKHEDDHSSIDRRRNIAFHVFLSHCTVVMLFYCLGPY